MRPIHQEVLDSRAEYLRWLCTPAGLLSFDGGQLDKPWCDPRTRKSLYEGLIASVRDAETFVVTEQITSILSDCYMDVPYYPLAEHDPISKCGFVIFEKPLRCDIACETTGERSPIPYVGFCWGTPIDNPCQLQCFLFTDITDYDAAIEVADERLAGEFREMGEERFRQVMKSVYPTYVLGSHFPIRFGVSEDEARGLLNSTTQNELLNLLLSFFRFVREPWLTNYSGMVDRATRKRAQRVGLRDIDVRVIALREAEHRSREALGGSANYSHRFLVRGFWRNQWYPSIQDHRPKYIAPFIKGPPDAPLIVKPRVFSVER